MKKRILTGEWFLSKSLFGYKIMVEVLDPITKLKNHLLASDEDIKQLKIPTDYDYV